MNTSVIPVEDYNYLAQQPVESRNMILSGMMALIQDANKKTDFLEQQDWFQRMSRTIKGQNKTTQLEIDQDRDKLNIYMYEAINELYANNKIEQGIVMSLGRQLNEVYADQIQLKKIIGALVSKLNEKIDSVDNFHMLHEEIMQGKYSNEHALISLCKVISQFDNRMLQDERKREIIKTSLKDMSLLNNEPMNLSALLMDIVSIPFEEAGLIYMELNSIRNSYIARLMLAAMESYHFLPVMVRKTKNKQVVVDNIIRAEGLDENAEFSLMEIYDDLINYKVEGTYNIPQAEIEVVDEELLKAEELFLACKFDQAFEIFMDLARNGNAKAMYFVEEYYKHGYGNVKKDKVECCKWAERGYEAKDVLASLNYAFTIENDDEKSELIEELFPALLKLAEGGDTFAQFELADLYVKHYEKTDEGIAWFRKSAADGYWESMYKLGIILFSDKFGINDYEGAAKLFEAAADRGYAQSVSFLAICYRDGNGVSKNAIKALNLMEKAYAMGDKSIGLRIGEMYYSGEAIEKNYDKAREWFQEPAENGNNEALSYMGIIEQESGNIEKAMRYFLQAAENGDPEAQLIVGLNYYNGENGLKIDYEKSFYWFNKAVENNETDAWFYLGCQYTVGDGITEDANKGKECFIKGAEAGDEACVDFLKNFWGMLTNSSANNIKKLCKDFLRKHGSPFYEVSEKLERNIFNSLKNKETYLMGDNTAFQTSKYGFAICRLGLFSTEFMSEPVFTSYYDLKKAKTISIKYSLFLDDKKSICIGYGLPDSIVSELEKLFRDIADAVELEW